MDVFSLVGIILAFAAVVGGSFLESGHAGALLNGPTALIVIGDTLIMALLQTPVSVLKHDLGMLGWVSFPSRKGLPRGIDRIVSWSTTVRKEGLFDLESIADMGPDPYARKGLQLLVDSTKPGVIHSILGVNLSTQGSRNLQVVKMLENMGDYAPTISVIGAIMDLIHMMGNLINPVQLGSGIVVAFVTTIYGASFANLLLLLVSDKPKTLVLRQSRYHEILLGGLLSTVKGENLRSIELKLQGFVD